MGCDVAPATATAPSPGVLAARLDAYAAATVFLSRVLTDSPDGLLLAQLSQPGVLDEWPLPVDESRAGLSSLAASQSRPAESLAEVYADHRRLFLGPEHVLACPYESVYLNEEHLTFGSQTLAVREWYHRYGRRAPGEGREPDDHIGLELGFVSELCLRALDDSERGAASLQQGCLAVGEFLCEHLLLWAEDCLDLVLTHASTHFYRGVAKLATATLSGLERDFVG